MHYTLNVWGYQVVVAENVLKKHEVFVWTMNPAPKRELSSEVFQSIPALRRDVFFLSSFNF